MPCLSASSARRSLQQQSFVSLGTPSQHTEAGCTGSGVAGQGSPCASPPTGLAAAGGSGGGTAAGAGCAAGTGGDAGGSFKLFDVCIEFEEVHTYEQQEAEEDLAQLAAASGDATVAKEPAEGAAAHAAGPCTPPLQLAA